MTLPKTTTPCDSIVREAAKMYTPSIYTKDTNHRTKKNLERRRFRGIKRHRTDNSSTTGLLSPPHSPRSHVSQSSFSSLHRTPSPDLSTDSEAEDNPKKPRFELVPYTPDMSVASSSTTTSSVESYDDRKQRYLKTAAALRQSGLLDITMKTAELLRKNQDLQRNIEALQNETRDFVTSVLSNKENRPLLTCITSRAQLYELVVPGSQNIMSVSAIPALESPLSPSPQTSKLLPPASNILPPAELDSSSSSPDQSSPTPNTSSSDPQSESSSLSDDNES